MIEYYNIGNGNIRVTLDGKIAGYIKPNNDGYRYYPLGDNFGGEWFKTIEEVKQSLEND